MKTQFNLAYKLKRTKYERAFAEAFGLAEKLKLDFDVVENFEEIVDQVASVLSERGVLAFSAEHCPYFGVLWPSALRLTNDLTDFIVGKYPRDVRGCLRVLELGGGLGLPSLALQKLGCSCWAVDHHQDAGEFLFRNWRVNDAGFGPHFWAMDWAELSGSDRFSNLHFDFIVASDILYEKSMVGPVSDSLILAGKTQLRAGGEIWITDPGRSYLQEFVTVMERAGFSSITSVQDDIFLIRFWRN